jgi:hypothetical protein
MFAHSSILDTLSTREIQTENPDGPHLPIRFMGGKMPLEHMQLVVDGPDLPNQDEGFEFLDGQVSFKSRLKWA